VDAGWIVAALAICVLGWERYKRERMRADAKYKGVWRPWPLKSVALTELDSVFTPGQHGPTRDTEVHFVGRGPVIVPGGTSDGEAWILSVLAKKASTLFEFGTCTGKTAYLWSRNAPADARIVTLTLAPTQRDSYHTDAADDAKDVEFALAESDFTEFLYTGTPEETRITQLYGDSKQFDETPYVGWADVVFVDGSHAESYVRSDSEKAMRIVKPGGLVLWHDYAGPRHAPGVFHALNELSKRVPLYHIKGTTFAAWRRPA
jgi:predicted O-methyltransferase YrrM